MTNAQTIRSNEDKKYLINRLKTIAGQVKGVSEMIEQDRYCNDILIQISAIEKSLKGVANEILKSHLATCVVTKIKNDELDIIDEIMELVRRLD